MNAIAEQDIINSATPLERHLVDQHPRIHLTPERLAFLKDNRDSAPWSRMIEVLGEQANAARESMSEAGTASRGSPGGRLPHVALRYLIFEDPDDLELAGEIMHATCQYDGPDGGGSFGGGWLYALGTAYDWLYHHLDQETLDETADYIHRRAQDRFEQLTSYRGIEATWDTCNHIPNYIYDLAVSGMAIYGHRPDVAPRLRYVLARTRSMIHTLGPDGVSQEGISYGGFFTDFFVRTVDVCEQLLDNDLFATSDWLKNTWAFYMYSMLPRTRWEVRNHIMGFGDGAPYHWHGPDNFLYRLAGYHQNGHAHWLADETFKKGLASREGMYLNLIWRDPELPPEGPDALPPFRYFDDQGMVFMRSDWDGDESMMGFHCAPHSGHFALTHFNTDVGGGHMYPDAGSFQLFAFGDRLITNADYTWKRTAYRNTILVNGIGQTGENNEWFESLELRRERRGPSIVHASSSDRYDVICADLTQAYEHAANAEYLIRHVVYLRPNVWVIIDDMAASVPSTFESLLHGRYDFEEVDELSYQTGGDSGRLQITGVYPGDLQHRTELQINNGIGEHHPDVPVRLLTFSNVDATSDARFVLLLEAFPVGGSPVASASVDGEVVKIAVAEKVFELRLPEKGESQPVEVFFKA